MLAAAGDDFIFTCKESSHKALYDFIDGAEPERHQEKIRKGKTVETRRYCWIEGVPVRDGKDAALVNWIGFEIFDRNSRVKYSIAWVTSLPVNKTNVAEIAACGRARWKIENEAFNVMKNHGYELEHNFGHGETFLAMTLAALNLLAFAWHSALDLLEAALASRTRRRCQAHQLLRPSPHIDDLCRLSFMGRLPRSPHHLHDPPGAAQNPENRMKHGAELLLELCFDGRNFEHQGRVIYPLADRPWASPPHFDPRSWKTEQRIY